MKRCLLVLVVLFNVYSVDKISANAQQRIAWTQSRVSGSPEPPKPYAVKRAYPKLNFKSPVEVMPLGRTGRMMLLEVGGKLWTFDDDPECEQADLAIDVKKLDAKANRAFGFGVHPDFDQNRQVFIVYSRSPIMRPDGTRLSRLSVNKNDPPTIDLDSEEVLLTWPSGGHNGSTVRFDPKGYLYFSAGDGARPYPPDEYDVSQDLSDLRSTICRIDVNQTDGKKLYSIPPGNPFVDTPGARPEIWAFGFRNPWRFDFVPGTNRILCGDVGWELWEMIYDVRRGGNYGWSLFEGPQPIRNDIQRGTAEISKPLIAYPHSIGQSVTGGIVYQGDALPELNGVYLYGDYVTGLLWGVRPDEQPTTWNPVLANTSVRLISFSQTRDKEPLILGYGGGIYRLVRNDVEASVNEFPRKLSETGLFDSALLESTGALKPNPGVYEYKLAAQAWQDGATATFAVGLPENATVKTHRMQRRWRHPKDAVYAKTLSLDVMRGGKPTERRIETQLLHFDGVNWQPYSYLWNTDQSDAELVPAEGGVTEVTVMGPNNQVITKPWRVTNRAECRSCHTPQTGGAVGFSFENLGADQVQSLVDLKVLDQVPAKNWKISDMVDPHDPVLTLQDRARSYLAANCAHCHRRGGGGTVALDLIFPNKNDAINAVDFKPTQGTFGITDGAVIKPGDPARSVLFYRMATSGAGHMPKLWTRENDLAGLKLVRDWIASLPNTKADGNRVDATTSDALNTFSRLLDQPNESAVRKELIARLASSETAAANDLVQRFLPKDQRRKEIGKVVDVDAILAMKGDAAMGRSRFFSMVRQQCKVCHRVQGAGVAVGPDLDGIGKKRDRKQLLQSILNPAADIDAKFQAHVVVKDSGEVVVGLKMSEDKQSITLRVVGGKNVRIGKNEIEATKISKASIMPEGLQESMTSQELADLLAFLSALK